MVLFKIDRTSEGQKTQKPVGCYFVIIAEHCGVCTRVMLLGMQKVPKSHMKTLQKCIEENDCVCLKNIRVYSSRKMEVPGTVNVEEKELPICSDKKFSLPITQLRINTMVLAAHRQRSGG